MPTLLAIDDEPVILSVVARALNRREWVVVIANDLDVGIEVVQRHTIDVVLCDVRLPRLDPFEFASGVRALSRAAPTVLMSGHPNPEQFFRNASRWWRPLPLLPKPFTIDQLEAAILSVTLKMSNVDSRVQRSGQ